MMENRQKGLDIFLFSLITKWFEYYSIDLFVTSDCVYCKVSKYTN